MPSLGFSNPFAPKAPPPARSGFFGSMVRAALSPTPQQPAAPLFAFGKQAAPQAPQPVFQMPKMPKMPTLKMPQLPKPKTATAMWEHLENIEDMRRAAAQR